jgi:hypothetical protein
MVYAPRAVRYEFSNAAREITRTKRRTNKVLLEEVIRQEVLAVGQQNVCHVHVGEVSRADVGVARIRLSCLSGE